MVSLDRFYGEAPITPPLGAVSHVGKETDGAIGSSDVDLAVAPDGTLYFVTLVFDRQAREGTHTSP